MKKILSLLSVFALTILLAACTSESSVIVIGEGSWDSNMFHDQVVKIIIEEGYGTEVEIVPADTAVLISSLKTGSVNVGLELWSDNVVTYDDDIANGDYEELAINFDDNMQGLYIPKYLQEEYPGLVSVQDLADYAHLFPTLEGGEKPVIYGGPESWMATAFLRSKIELYGLADFYDFKSIDSMTTVNATLASAYAAEEPWIGYNWEPTWVLGKYELVLLEDSPYSAADYAEGKGAFPSVDVTVVVDSEFGENHPELYDFLKNYETSSAITSSALAIMQENDGDAEIAARWFLTEYEDLWSSWVTEEAREKIMEAIK